MKNKKNIALLFFGRINFCKKSFKTLKNAINFKDNNIYTFLSSDNGSTEDLNDFIKLYKPVKYNNDEIKYKNKIINNKPCNYYGNYVNINMIKHFINRKRVTKLLIDYIYETNIHFDIIITLRADLHFNNKIELIFPLEENTIYLPDTPNNSIGIMDQFHYGDLNTMFKINNVFNNLKYIDYNYMTYSYKYPETILYGNKNIYNINKYLFSIDYYIIRN